MRKAFTLAEIIVLIAIIPVVSAVLYGLLNTVILDIPPAVRVAQENTTLLTMLSELRRDINSANELPESLEGQPADPNVLLIVSPSGVSRYRLEAGRIIKTSLPKGTETGGSERTWVLPNCGIMWKLWSENGKNYAVEVRTHIMHGLGSKRRETMANSHLYFVGTLAGGAN
jgi:hypothetical protein